MKNTKREDENVDALKFILAPAEVTDDIGSFYTGADTGILMADAARCDCLACREQQRQRSLFNREPT